MSSDYKPMEPVTVVTDMILALLGLLLGIVLLYYWMNNKDKRQKDSLMWIGGFLSIALFAFFGVLSHGTTSIMLGKALWPPTMIFGGITFVFFVSGVIIYQKETNYKKLLVLPIVLVILYLIIGVMVNWPFLLWVVLLLICSVIIYVYAFKAKSDGKELAPYLIYGLTIIIIAGVIQAIGGIIGYEIMFGPNNEYLFRPHNDIFHIIAMVGLCVFFWGFRKELI